MRRSSSKSARRRNALRRERIDLLREALIQALGGHCARCGYVPRRLNDLEIDHVDGITWNRYAFGREQRIRRYVAEYREGVRLQALCRDCHAQKHPRVRQAWIDFEAWAARHNADTTLSGLSRTPMDYKPAKPLNFKLGN